MAKYIGIFGGLGYKATALAYNKLNELYQKTLGNGHTCPIKMLAIDFKNINDILPYRIEEAAEMMKPHLEELRKLDVACFIMINNTLHQSLDIVLKDVQLNKPLGHIGTLIKEELNKKKARSVMILGSKFTMNDGYLKGFIPKQVNIVIPDSKIQEDLEQLRKIYYNGINPNMAAELHRKINEQYPDIDVILLACTEHSIAFETFRNSKWIDTMDLQCEFAIKEVLDIQ